MKLDMSSDKTLLAMAIASGAANTLLELAIGGSLARLLITFFYTAAVGTLFTFAVVWVALRLFRKQHLTNAVTNWMLAFGTCASLFLAYLRSS